MIAWFLALDALGHGDEEHASPPPLSAAADVTRVPTWSTEFEAVLAVPYAPPGEAVEGRLLLADFGTSAPVSAGEATLALHGPGDVAASIRPGDRPGIWPFTTTFPADGEYAGSLTLVTPDRADLLGLPAFTVAPPPSPPAPTGFGWPALALTGLACLVAGLALGLLPGWLLARRAAPAALLLLLAAPERGVRAHGGEDHAAPAAPSSSGGDLALPLESQFLLELRTARAARGPLEERVRALGQAVPSPGSGAELHAPVTGILEALPGGLAPGSIVRAGQTVAVIREQLGGAERSDVASGRSAALVQLAEAKKALAVAERDAARARELVGVLSEREQLEREQALAVAREAVRQAETAAGALGGAVPTTVLTAPISGRISALVARPGDVVSASDVLMRIVGSGGAWVEARVPEALAGRLVEGSPATVVADARPDEALPATVLDPGLEADPRTGTLRVTLALEPVPWLKPGMTTSASIVAGAARDALLVPDAAVVDSGGESLVFVKTAPETFETRTVRIGALAGEQREVLAGLEPGERVVVQGTYALRSLAGR